MPAVCFFMDKNLPIMDKAEEMSLLQYAMTVTETYTQNEMEVIFVPSVTGRLKMIYGTIRESILYR